MLLANLHYMCGSFYFDWSETHVLNPRWPPHAKFHNGQTMSLSVLLSACSIYFAFMKPTNASMVVEKDNLFWAAVIGSLYCLAGGSAILYPGSDWKDPEATEGGKQPIIFGGVITALWVGYALEMRRLSMAKVA